MSNEHPHSCIPIPTLPHSPLPILPLLFHPHPTLPHSPFLILPLPSHPHPILPHSPLLILPLPSHSLPTPNTLPCQYSHSSPTLTPHSLHSHTSIFPFPQNALPFIASNASYLQTTLAGNGSGQLLNQAAELESNISVEADRASRIECE